MSYTETKQIKKEFNNDDLKMHYDYKNEYMRYMFSHTELSTGSFLEECFLEAINNGYMQEDNVYNSGKANGRMTFYSPKLSRSLHYKTKSESFLKKNKKVILTKDNLYDFNIYGLNFVIASTNLHYGLTGRGSSNLAYFCNFDIDLDGIYTYEDFGKLITKIENGEILKPTIITNSGTGCHLIYRLKMPIFVYKREALKSYLKIIKDALCAKIETVYDFSFNKFKGTIKGLALDQMTRLCGSTTKLGEFADSLEKAKEDTCRAWLIGDSLPIEDIFKYCEDKIYASSFCSAKKELKKEYEEDLIDDLHYDDIKERTIENVSSLEDMILRLSKTKLSVAKTVKSGGKEYSKVKDNLYYSWLKRCENEVKEGSRYYALLGLVSYALKCGISYDTLFEDTKKLQSKYNEASKELLTDEDVMSALDSFNDDKNRFLKGVTIAKRCGLTVKNIKRNGRCQKEHLEIARKNNGRKSKEKECYKLLKNLSKTGIDIRKKSLRELENLTGISKSTIAIYIKDFIIRALNKTNLNIKKKYRNFKNVFDLLRKNEKINAQNGCLQSKMVLDFDVGFS